MVDQPGAGTARSYKIRGHTRQRRSTKPYARPSEVRKKSLVEKVRDYLTPSWFFGYFQTDEVEDDSSDSEVDIVEEDTTRNDQISHPGRDISFQENPAGLLAIGEEDSILVVEEGTQLVTTSGLEGKDRVFDGEHSHFSEYLENNNKGEACTRDEITTQLRESENRNRSDHPDDDINVPEPAALTETAGSSSSNLSYSSQLKRKPLPSILHSRTLTSSLFQNSGLLAAARPQGSPLLSLGSTTRSAVGYSSQNPSIGPSRINTSSGNVGTSSTSLRRAQPVAPVASAPGFSVSTFVTPVARSFTNKPIGSPFYPGRITYGGALSNSGYTSSSRKRQRRNSPNSELYQPVRKHQIRAKPLPNACQGGSTTKTAQRILEALESVSSPLRDVRRIPSPRMSPMTSPLSFSAPVQPSQSRTRPPKVGPRVSSLQAKLLGGPPVEALSAPQIAKVTGIDNREPSNSRTSSTPFAATNIPSSKSLFGGLDNTVLKTSLPAGFTPKALLTSLSPGEKTSKTSGKMRSSPRGATHYSLRNNAEDDEVVNPLPEIVHAVPLPVSSTKNMSPFFFAPNKSAETSASSTKFENPNKPLEASTAEDKTATEATKNGFIFSNPKRKLPIVSVKEALAMADEEVSFMFSQPVSVKAKEDKIQNTVTESVKDISKNAPIASRSTTQGSKTTSSTGTVISSNEHTTASATQNSLAKMFAPAPGEWSCSSCMIPNKAADQKCVACGTAGASKTLSEATGTPSNGIDLAKKFALKEGTWNCETCMVNNEASAVKCISCGSGKPSTEKSRSSDPGINKGQSLKIKFAPPANTWACGECMIRNQIEDNKCAACETAKPGATATVIDLKKKFAAPADSWNCEVCMITNQSSEVKCVACETNKPGTEAGAFSSCSGSGFIFGGGATSTSTAPSLAFGNAVSENPKSVFTLGSGTAATETTKPEFTFGFSSTKEENTTPKFTFGAGGGSGSDSKSTGFTFGGSDKKSTSNDGNDKEKDKEIVNENLNKVVKPEVGAPPLNIAQAAAAGLLKVPGIGNTESKSKKASANQPTLPLQPSKSPPNGSVSFLPPPKNLPDSTTATPVSIATAKRAAPSVETVVETVKITPFNFGASTNTQTSLGEKTGNHGFNFGMTSSSKPQTTPFNVGAIASDKTGGKPTFNLEASVTTSKKNSPAPVFKFGTAEQSTAVSDTPSLFQNTITTVSGAKSQTSGLFTFAAADGKSKAPVFNFGASNNPPSSTTGNNTSETQAVTAANALFNFTAGQPSNADTENHNSLGGEEMEADSNSNHDSGQSAFGSNGGFSFPVQTSGNTSGLFTSSGTSGTSGTSGFNFGSTGGTTIPLAFQFGTPSNDNTNTPSGGFNFGANSVLPSGGSPFVFGSAPANTASAPANSSTPSAGFNFNAKAPTNTPTFNLGQTNAGGFNVGAPGLQRVYKKALRRTKR